MNYKGLSFGLGVFSIALGAAELLATRRIARALDQDDVVTRNTLRAFGVREAVAGVGLLANPAHSTGVWSRVAGDVVDLAALGLAARRAPKSAFLWGAVSFVAAAAAIDVFTARGLDRETGKAAPIRSDTSGASALAEPKASDDSIEPERVAHATAPSVG